MDINEKMTTQGMMHSIAQRSQTCDMYSRTVQPKTSRGLLTDGRGPGRLWRVFAIDQPRVRCRWTIEPLPIH
jgi:hypothetical protein